MRGEVTFTMIEVTRYSIIQSLLERKMVNKEAALSLNLSLRQVQRMKRKVEVLGPAGVLHGNKGRAPAHAFSLEEKYRIITMVENRYFNFNFSHLSEMLEEEENIRINRETLRRWLRPRGGRRGLPPPATVASMSLRMPRNQPNLNEPSILPTLRSGTPGYNPFLENHSRRNESAQYPVQTFSKNSEQ